MTEQKDESFVVEARRLRTHPAAWLGLLLPLVVTAFPMTASTAIYAGTAFIAALSTLLSRPKFRWGSLPIRVERGAVEIDGRRVDGAALNAVLVHAADSGAHLELDPGPFRRSQWFEVAGVGVAREIAENLRDDASRVRLHFRPSTAFESGTVTPIAAMFALMGAVVLGLPYWAALLAAAALYFGARAARSLEVGVDGVHLRAPFQSIHLDPATLKATTTARPPRRCHPNPLQLRRAGGPRAGRVASQDRGTRSTRMGRTRSVLPVGVGARNGDHVPRRPAARGERRQSLRARRAPS